MGLLEHLTFIEPERDLSTALPWHYDPTLVMLSIVIAIFASYTAFLIVERIHFSERRSHAIAWLVTGSLSLGCGVWAMHFVGMLAYILPITVSYDVFTTVLSVGPAILASLIVFRNSHSQTLSLTMLFYHSLLLGGGIGLMHYVGMAAMRMSGVMRYDPALFYLSILIAVVLAGISLVLKCWAFKQTLGLHVFSPRLLIASIVMGLAVSAMHYTGMAAMSVYSSVDNHAHNMEWSADTLVMVITSVSISISVFLMLVVALTHRYQLHQRVRESETRQKVIVEAAADGIITIDKLGHIDTFNPAAEKIFGYAAEEVKGKNVSLLLPKDERVEHEGYTTNSTLHESRILNHARDLFGLHKDGSTFPLELHVTPMNLLGEIGFVGVVRDISQRVEAEAIITRRHQTQKVLANVLRASLEPISLEAFLQKSIEIVIDSAVVSTKPAGAIFLADEKTEKLSMVAQKGLHASLLIQCAQIKYGTCHCGMAAKTKSIQFSSQLDHRHVIQFDGIQPHGHYCIPILLQSRLLGVLNIYLEAGHQSTQDEIEFFGMLSDTLAGIIDKRLGERELSRFKATLDHTLDCVFMFEPENMKFSYVNEGAVQLVGYSKEALMAMSPYDIKPDYDEAQFRALISPMLMGDESVVSIETVHRHKDGHDVPVEIFLQYISPPDTPPRFVELVRDITERQRVDKLKSEFVSTVSHELRTPLTAIRGSLGLMSNGVLGEIPEKMAEMLKIAGNNTERLLLLVNDILDLQKIESGEMDFSFQKLELMPFIEKVIQDNQAYAKQHNVCYKLVQYLEGATLYADPDRLAQIMSNLLSNAAKFSPEQSTVKLAVTRHKELIRIAVSDDGPGIPDEHRGKVFKRFCQVDSTDTRKVGGTGLGLAICKTLMERHGGEIDFTSTQGEGTTFYIELPIYSEALEKKLA